MRARRHRRRSDSFCHLSGDKENGTHDITKSDILLFTEGTRRKKSQGLRQEAALKEPENVEELKDAGGQGSSQRHGNGDLPGPYEILQAQK